MSEAGVSDNLFPSIGMFHAEKVLLRYLTGSGMDSAQIESNVFGHEILNSVQSDWHYERALLECILLQKFQSPKFLKHSWLLVKILPCKPSKKDLRNILADRNRSQSTAKLEELVEYIVVLKTLVDAYMNKCEEESQLCKCFRNILRIFSIIKKAITADRDGNWALHIAACQYMVSLMHTVTCV